MKENRLAGPRPKISVFPKCYFDELCNGSMDYIEWIHEAAGLGGEGLEHYDGFLKSLNEEDVEPVSRAMRESGQETSMVCFSPG